MTPARRDAFGLLQVVPFQSDLKAADIDWTNLDATTATGRCNDKGYVLPDGNTAIDGLIDPWACYENPQQEFGKFPFRGCKQLICESLHHADLELTRDLQYNILIGGGDKASSCCLCT